MRLSAPPRRPPAESVTPMINVVFLLLIFFLMTATIAPPEPFRLEPPRTEAEAARDVSAPALSVAADGRLAFGEARGDAALVAAAAWTAAGPATSSASTPARALVIRADAGVEGAALARLLARLGGMGVARTTLAVVGAPSGG